jgi:hypothetical protein
LWMGAPNTEEEEFVERAANWLVRSLRRQHNVNRILDSTLLNVKIFPRGRSLTKKNSRYILRAAVVLITRRTRPTRYDTTP